MDNWIAVLEENPDILYEAAKDATKIFNEIVAIEKAPDISQNLSEEEFDVIKEKNPEHILRAYPTAKGIMVNFHDRLLPSKYNLRNR